MSRNDTFVGNREFVFGRDKKSIASAYIFRNFVSVAEQRCTAEQEKSAKLCEEKLEKTEKTFKSKVLAYETLRNQLFELGTEMQKAAHAQGYTFENVYYQGDGHRREKVSLHVKWDSNHRYQSSKLFTTKYMPLVVELYETLILTEFSDLATLLSTFIAKLEVL